MIEVRHLRYFCAVAQARNFTRAAENLHMAQPPLSRQIQQLEAALGVGLFERRRPVTLTEAGRFFHDQALQILDRLEQITATTQRIGQADRGVFTIGFVGSILYGMLPALVRRLRQERPDLDVRLSELTTLQQVEALKEGRIDIGFGRIVLNDPLVRRVVLRDEPLVVALWRGHPLAGGEGPIPLAALADQSLIVFPKSPRPSFADQILALLTAKGVKAPDVHEVRELQTALGLVAAQVGVCLAPASARALRPDDLIYRLIADPEATSPIIMSHRLNDTSPVIAVVKRLIVEIEEPRVS